MKLKTFAALIVLLSGFAVSCTKEIYVSDIAGLRSALSQTSGPTIINVAPGRYDLTQEDAHHEWIFVSCTSSEEEWADKTKIFGLWLKNLSNVTIKGPEAKFICHGDMTPIGISDCRNITIEGIEIDFERPGASEFRYESVEPGKTVCRFNPDSWYVIEDSVLWLVGEGWRTETPHCNRYFVAEKHLAHSGDWDVLRGSKAVELQPGLVCFATPETFHPAVGDIITVRDRIRRQTGSLIQLSENIRLQGMKYRFMHGIGVLSQLTRNVSVIDCTFAPAPESGRILASSADFVHFSDCAGLVEVKNCYFSGAQDDPINVHGTNLRVVRRVSGNSAVVRFMHPQTYGIREYTAGDTVAFGHAELLDRYANAVVKKAERLDDREILLTFDRELPDSLKTGSDFVENLTWSPEVVISSNVFSCTSTRGVLLTTPRRTLIENNVFRGVRMSGILIGADASSWYSSGPVKDVTIRGNMFEDCTFVEGNGFAQISVYPENRVVDSLHPVDRNIRILDNTFILGPGNQAIYAKSVRGLTIKDNRITRNPENRAIPEIILNCCSDVESDMQ